MGLVRPRSAVPDRGNQGSANRPDPASQGDRMSAQLAIDVETPVREGLTSFATFVPKLLGFLVILLIGYIVAKAVSKVVDRLLERAGFDRAVEKGGIKKALAKS